MGRWLKKLENMPKVELTDLTQPTSVGCVRSVSGGAQKNNTKNIDSFDFVLRCCISFQINPQQVVDRLLSAEDEQDIINNKTPPEALRTGIDMWLAAGMPYQSGK